MCEMVIYVIIAELHMQPSQIILSFAQVCFVNFILYRNLNDLIL